jgi:peptidoglycan hydrolase-like protein with peptidoglycan-binding domain
VPTAPVVAHETRSYCAPMIRNRRRTVARLLLLALTASVPPLTTPATATADPTPTTWTKLRTCESSNRYTTNTGNGYYGAYQFDLPTWRSVGGKGRPDQATPTEQDYRALYLYRMRGWQPWQCATMLNLPADADARSKRVPTYTESASIGGGAAPTPHPAGSPPAWPGVVYDYGDCADPLKTFQLRMNTFGYGFTGTGCYYDKTRTAVLALQRANGIKDSGLLGPQTWNAAWNGKPPR